MAGSEFWSGVMAGVFGTVGATVALSVLVIWLLARNAPTVPENWDV
jgi:hypothetical protein